MAYIRMNPPNNELGNAKPVINVDLTDPKKKNTTMIQSKIPNVILSLTSKTFKQIGIEPSRTIIMSALIFFSFKRSLTVDRRSFTRSATATVLDPDCLYTSRKRDVFPSIDENRVAVSNPRVIVAISDSKTGRSDPTKFTETFLS